MQLAHKLTPHFEPQRLNERVFAYWENLRGTRPYPLESELEPEALGEIWRHCFVLNTQQAPAPQAFHYSYIGKALKDAYGEHVLAGAECNQAMMPHIAAMLHHLQSIRIYGRPIIDESEFTNTHNIKVKYRCSLLPLGLEDGGVGRILGCMRWKWCE